MFDLIDAGEWWVWWFEWGVVLMMGLYIAVWRLSFEVKGEKWRDPTGEFYLICFSFLIMWPTNHFPGFS